VVLDGKLSNRLGGAGGGLDVAIQCQEITLGVYIFCLPLSGLLASIHVVGLVVVVHCGIFCADDGMDEEWCECSL
jgi:hypothetical protein